MYSGSNKGIQMEQVPQSPPFSLTRFMRIGLAGFFGLIEGVIYTPITLVKNILMNQPDPDSEPASSAFTLGVVTVATILGPIFAPLNHIEKNANKEDERVTNDNQAANWRGEVLFPEDSQPGFWRMFFYGLVGFIVGIPKAVIKGVEAVYKAPLHESILLSIFMAPFRFLGALFSTPFENAKEWAWLESRSAPEKSSTEEMEEGTEGMQLDAPPPLKISRVIDYLAVAFYAVAGFVIGLIQAPIQALLSVFAVSPEEKAADNYAYEYEHPLKSLLMGIPRFLKNLFLSPFQKAAQWVAETRTDIDYQEKKREHQKAQESSNGQQKKYASQSQTSLVDYLQLGISVVFGFFIGLITAPFYALENALSKDDPFFDNTGESFLESLLLAPFRFINKFVEHTKQTVKDALKNEKYRLKYAAAYFQEAREELSGMGDYLGAFFKGLLGFVAGAIAAPFIAIYGLFIPQPDRPEKSLDHFFKTSFARRQNENFLTTLIKIPFRLVGAILAFPLFLAEKFAFTKPESKKGGTQDGDGAEGQHGKSVNPSSNPFPQNPLGSSVNAQILTAVGGQDESTNTSAEPAPYPSKQGPQSSPQLFNAGPGPVSAAAAPANDGSVNKEPLSRLAF